MADIPQYPFMFSPDQWSNKFSPYQGKPIPFPASYLGPATDAHGNVIQSYADTQAKHDAWQAPAAPQQAAPVTLNTSPLQPSRDPYANPGPTAANYSAQTGIPSRYTQGGTFDNAQANADYARNGIWSPVNGPSALRQQPAQAAAAPTNPYDMNQAYLDALANPGHVTTPGATVPQSALPSNQSGVMQQFLANWNKGGGQTKGAGNYDNSGFFKALRGQV